MTRTPSPFIEPLSQFMQARRYSSRTIESYLYWIKYFIHYHDKRHLQVMGERKIERFLMRAIGTDHD